MDLVGSDASDHDYIIGGPDLLISLGTWIQKFNCGGLVYSNLKYSEQKHGDWFKFDQISHQLHVFGHPFNLEGEPFEFIFEALQASNVIVSSVFRINFVNKSSDVVESVASQYFSVTRNERNLLDCTFAGGNTMI